MAISIDIHDSHFGIPFPGAYFRVMFAALSRNVHPNMRFSVMIDIAGFATVPQHEEVREIATRRYHAPLEELEAQSGDTFLAKCYSWVMNQPDMNGSIAV